MQVKGKLMNRTWENGEKPHFELDLGPMGPNSFVKNLASPVTRYHGQLSEKTNDPILWKFSDRRTDGQRDESDFIGRCPTNVERRKGVKYVQNLLQNTRTNVWLYC